MRDGILAEQCPKLLTTIDAARMLAVTVHGVRWLARTQQLAYERTPSGQRLFRPGDVLRLVERRAKARLVGGVGPPPPLAPVGEPRQLSLFGKARLRLVEHEQGERSLRDPVAKAPGFVKERARV